MSHSHASNFSDHTRKCRLIETGDIERLTSESNASQYIENENVQITKLKAQIAEELNRKYPNNSYINNCMKKITAIKENILIHEFVRRK